tara:strand:+ start:49 stop:504 length:456 start_codon:yes stop_codon:yes gene_type:complete
MEYVYKITNNTGIVEWIGTTNNPKRREKQHIHKAPKEGWPFYGKFYNRTDVVFSIVNSFEDKDKALIEEGRLKQHYGLEWTEKTRTSKGGTAAYKKGVGLFAMDEDTSLAAKQKGGRSNAARISTCEHCGKTGKFLGMIRSHFDKCKHKDV